MAKSQALHYSVLLFFFFLCISQSAVLSSARPLINGHFPQSIAAATEPDFNKIALPSNKVNAPPVKDDRFAKPCDMDAGKRSDTGIPAAEVVYQPTAAGKYRPLVLNVLPKGRIPSSGPSRRTNAVKN